MASSRKMPFTYTRHSKAAKIIVYGAGESFHYFKEIVMRRYGYIPSVVLDRKFSHGDTFEGIPAFSPLEYQPAEEKSRMGWWSCASVNKLTLTKLSRLYAIWVFAVSFP